MGHDDGIVSVSGANRGIGYGVTLEWEDGHCRLQIAKPYEVLVPYRVVF